MKKYLPLIIISILLLSSSSLFAKWVYFEKGSAFDDAAIHLIMTGSSGYAFGLRCRDKELLEVVYITNEKIEDLSSIDALNKVNPKLLIKVDKNKIFTLDTEISLMNSKVGAVSESPEDLLSQIVEAKKGISVATNFMGNIVHEKKFNIVGSTEKGKKLIKECGINKEE